MKIEEITKKRFLEYLSHGHSNGEWRILIIDDYTHSILKSIMDLNILLSYDILLVKNIKEKREKVNYPVIYYLNLSDENKKIIKSDIKSELYPKYKIFTVNESGEFNVNVHHNIKITKVKVKYQKIDICYKIKNGVVICNFEDIINFCSVLNINPNVHIAEDSYIKINRKDSDELNQVFSNRPRIGDILIFDRRLDVFTPLCHFYTFQSILFDFGLINEPFEDNIWEQVKYIHLAEINEILSEKAKKLISGFKKIDKANTKDLGRLVLEAPENIQTKKILNKLLDITDQTLNIYQEKGEYITNYEMDIVNGYKVNNSKVSISEFFDILRDAKVSKNDKLRILLLLKSTRGINDIKSEIDDTGVFSDIEWVSNMPNQKPHKSKKYKYEISRYVPKLEKTLQHFYGGKENIYSYSVSEPTSLRKKGFYFKSEAKKILIIYFKNGVTYEELRIADEIGKKEGVKIIVASDELMTYREFIERIKKGNL